MRGMAEARGTIGVRVVRSRLGYSNTRWDETNKQNLGVNDKESEGRTPASSVGMSQGGQDGKTDEISVNSR